MPEENSWPFVFLAMIFCDDRKEGNGRRGERVMFLNRYMIVRQSSSSVVT